MPMSEIDISVKLPRINSESELTHQLEEMASASGSDKQTSADRHRELKTYMLESNEPFPSQFELDGAKHEVLNTGLDTVKILRIHGAEPIEFYLDTTSERFLVLHTNCKTDETRLALNRLAGSFHHKFDHVWFFSALLKKIPDACQSEFDGFGIKYRDDLMRREGDLELNDINMNVSGALAEKIIDVIKEDSVLNNIVSYNSIKTRRGEDPDKYVRVDIHNDGYFAVKHGKSIVDHLEIVNVTCQLYKNAIKKIEDCRIGTDGTSKFLGHAIHFSFPKHISDLDLFVQRMFNGYEPFKMWGVKRKVDDKYYGVRGVDLHTGDPINFEISSDMMRVYLYKGGCGNTVLRILTNLQMHYDTNTDCTELWDFADI